jgi:hypothetical protein
MSLLGYESATSPRGDRGSGGPRSGIKRSNSRDSQALVETIRKRIEDSIGSSGRASTRRLREAFEECDADGSGDIDGAELKKAMKFLQVDLSKDEVRDIFTKFDESGNGRLNYREFMSLLGY